MRESSHRIKIEERKLYHKIVLLIVGVIALGIFMIFVGIPLFVQGILFVTGFRKDKPTTNTVITENTLFPPSLDPLPDATNSGNITLSGYGEKDATVVVLVNDQEVKKAQTDTDGKFLILNLPIQPGDNTITTKSVKDNKESSPSSGITISYLNKPPKLDISSPQDGDKFASDKKQIVIHGTTDPDNRVTLNDRTVVVDTQGGFQTTFSLSDGDNQLDFKSFDAAGNSIEKKIKVTYYP